MTHKYPTRHRLTADNTSLPNPPPLDDTWIRHHILGTRSEIAFNTCSAFITVLQHISHPLLRFGTLRIAVDDWASGERASQARVFGGAHIVFLCLPN